MASSYGNDVLPTGVSSDSAIAASAARVVEIALAGSVVTIATAPSKIAARASLRESLWGKETRS
jgi:hypothetical protein